MSVGITVEIDEKGKINVGYAGFQGNACFTEAGKLVDRLRDLGVDMEEINIQPTKTEVEVRRIPASQKVGSGG